MIRFQNAEVAKQARDVFNSSLRHCRRLELEEWRKSRTLWQKIKQRFAYWVLVRLDPYFARRLWRRLPD
jgi:hypothetical protein